MSGKTRHEQHSHDHDKGMTDHVKKNKHEASNRVKAEHIKEEIINKRTKPGHEHQHADTHNKGAGRGASNKRKHLKHTEAVTL